MNKKLKIPLMSIPFAIALFIALAFVILDNSPILWLKIAKSEKADEYVYSKLEESKKLEAAFMTVELDGEILDIPLPDGAVVFENQYYPMPEEGTQYLLYRDNFKKYKEKMLDCGYVLDEMGSMKHFVNNSLGIRVNYLRSSYAHCERIVVSVRSQYN